MTEAGVTSAGCELKSTKIDIKPKTVSVNGVTIARGDIARETQNHVATTPLAAWKMAARALVIRQLLLQEANRQQIQATPLDDGEGRRETPEEAAMRALIEQEVRVPKADEETCRRYFDQNAAKFRSAPLYAARHILFAAAPADVTARDAARVEAERICELLAARPDMFADLAKEFSACPSSGVGGSLGQIGPGQTVPEFEKALAHFDAGQAPAIVETRYGVHIVALDQKVEGKPLPFEIVRDKIASYLDEAVHRRAVRQYIGILADQATITGVDFLVDADSSGQ
jgi:peptidyl-prolyl cis-trans isomerase C